MISTKTELLLAVLAMLCAIGQSSSEPRNELENEPLNLQTDDDKADDIAAKAAREDEDIPVDDEGIPVDGEGIPVDDDDGSLADDEDDDELRERMKKAPGWGGRRRRRWGGVRLRRVSFRRVRLRRVRLPRVRLRRVRLPRVRLRRVRLPRVRLPRVRFRRVRLPRVRLRRVRLPRVGRLIRRFVRSRLVRRIKKVGRKVTTIPRRMIINKVKTAIKKILKKITGGGGGGGGGTDKVVPTVGPTVGPTISPTQGCDANCQKIKGLAQSTAFFRQDHCAFYMARRQHRDFFLDRNKNKTLESWVASIVTEALDLYKAYADALKAVKKDFVVKTGQQLRQACITSARTACTSKPAQDVMAFYKLKCLKPCAGFSGCTSQDANLVKLINNAIAAHDNKLNIAGNSA
eukprot:gene7187-7993_t